MILQKPVLSFKCNDFFKNGQFEGDIIFCHLNQQLELYLRYKRYKQPICDVFPIIAANALKTELCIINQTGNNSCDLITLPPRSPSKLPILYLHRINGNHYNGLQRSPAPYSSQCLATQPSAALVTPAGPDECHIKPSAALSTAAQDECHPRQIGSFPALAQTHTTSAAPQIGHHTRPSAVLTVPALQSHVSSSVSAQGRHQTRLSAVPPAIPQVDNHAVLHSPSQVNCQTKSSVAHTPWQISSKDGQSQAMQDPARLKYSAAELRSLRHSHKLKRSVRKPLFKYNIWQPRSRSCDIFSAEFTPMEAEFTPMEASANITIGLLNAGCVCNKALLVSDMIIDKGIDVLALTEHQTAPSQICYHQDMKSSINPVTISVGWSSSDSEDWAKMQVPLRLSLWLSHLTKRW